MPTLVHIRLFFSWRAALYTLCMQTMKPGYRITAVDKALLFVAITRTHGIIRLKWHSLLIILMSIHIKCGYDSTQLKYIPWHTSEMLILHKETLLNLNILWSAHFANCIMRAPAKNVLFSLLLHVSDFRTDYLCHEMRRKVNIGILRKLYTIVYSSGDGRSSKKQTYPVKTRKYGKN